MTLPRIALHVVLLALVVVLAAAAPARAQQGPPAPVAEYDPKAWKEFVSQEGRFSIRMIGTPRASTQEVDTVMGKLLSHTYLSQTKTGGYMVGYTDFPRYEETPAFVKGVLDGARNKLIEGGKRRMLSEREITVEGHAAREWLVEDGPLVFRARTLFVSGRLYQLLLAVPPTVAFTNARPSPRPEDRTALFESISKIYFDSFKLRQ